MGKILSIWSQTRKAGKTTLLYHMASHMAEKLEDSQKILVCCANLAQGNLMSLFQIAQNELNLEDLVNFKITSGGDINIFEAMAKRSNIFFTGSSKTGSTYAARNIIVYEELLRDFKGWFDLILVDTFAGKENPLTNMILQKSDFVLNMVGQDKENLDTHPFKTDRDLLYIANCYRDIYPDAKELQSLYKLNRPVYTLPRCDQLQEMKNKGKLPLYLQHETPYNTAVKEISAYTAGKIGLKLKADAAGNQRKRGFLKNAILNVLGEVYEQHG